MSLDFALKDFYRKKKQTYPFVFIIALVVGLSVFFVYFTYSMGINIFSESSLNQLYLTGAIKMVFSQYSSLIIILVMTLTFLIVIIITTTLVIHKKRDMAIMKALGTLPGKMYNFYILESYVVFLLGFFLGLICGLITFGLFALIMFLLNSPIIFQLDIVYIPILFLTCLFGIFIITGYKLRKIGNENIIKSFSKDIPYDYDVKQRVPFFFRKLSKIGFNTKIAVINTMRRKGEFRRYILIFTFIFLIIFTLGLGAFVLNQSSREWIAKSQGENIVIIGHNDVVSNYSQMYQMFSNPSITVNESDINFMDAKYLFNLSQIPDINTLTTIEKIDERLIKFCSTFEMDGIHFYQDDDEAEGGPSSGYSLVGKRRSGVYPIIGVNSSNLLQSFEMDGKFFTKEDSFINITIGDGLAYNFFEYPFDQSLKIVDLLKTFDISGVVIDSLFSGYAGYISLDIFQDELNLTNNEINLIAVKLKAGMGNDTMTQIDTIVKSKLGNNFACVSLDDVFQKNMDFISNLSLYPMFLIIIMALVAVLSLYNYQKAGLIEKAKDFLIMRAIGTKTRALKKIMFLEAFFILVPSVLMSLSAGMILNSIFLFDRVYLPPLFIPFLLMAIIFVSFLVFNYLSLNVIMKKVNEFSIKDFEIY